MSFAPLGDADQMDEDYVESAKDEEDLSSIVDTEVTDILTQLQCSTYADVNLYADPGVWIKIHLEIGNTYILFAKSTCAISPQPIMPRIRAYLDLEWKRKDGHAALYQLYGEKDDFYRAMAAKCQSLGKYNKPDDAKLELLINWAKFFQLDHFIRGDRLFIRFNSPAMEVDFGRMHNMHAIGIIEVGDPPDFI